MKYRITVTPQQLAYLLALYRQVEGKVTLIELAPALEALKSAGRVLDYMPLTPARERLEESLRLSKE